MKRFLVLLLIGCTLQAAQIFRVDPSPVMTTAGNAPYGGNPALYAVSSATIQLCTDAACSIPATTYTDVSGNTTCPSYAPVVQAGTIVCASTTGPQGQFGFWLAPGTYYYRVTLPSGQSYGSYPITSNTAGVTDIAAGAGISVSGSIGSVTISNTGALSFNGRTGAITPTTGDYVYSQIGGAKQGTTNVPQMAGTNSGVTGAVLCNDASGNATTGACSNGVTSAIAGPGISVDAATGPVTFTNTGARSFNGRTGVVVPVSADYSWSMISGIKQGTTSVPQMAGVNSGALGAVLCDDTNGNATTVGCAAGFALPTGLQTQYLRLQPNAGNNTTPEFASLPRFSVLDYAWSQSITATVSVGANTIAFAPCPLGANGSNATYDIRLSGGTGSPAPELVRITGGSCTSGGISGTLAFTSGTARAGTWTAQSATAGWQEAAQAAGANGSVYFAPGTYALYGPFTAPFNGQTYWADDSTLVTVTQPNGNNLHVFANTGSASDLTFLRLGWDGNWINQTYTAATVKDAINGTGSIRLRVLGNRFHAYGGPGIDGAYNQVISLYSAHDCQIRDNTFLSNLAVEINMNGTAGCAITGNTFGSPNMSDSKTPTNWWDTYSGGHGTIAIAVSDIEYSRNRMFGSARAVSGGTITNYGYLISGGGGPGANANVSVRDNEFEGLGNSRGTVSVTNGSGTVTGSNTAWVAIDTKRSFMVEGDGTVYTITAFTSATQITVTPVIARASGSGLRHWYQNSGDAISVGPITGEIVSGNKIYNSADNGIDIGGVGGPTSHVIVSHNMIHNSQVDGLYMGGFIFDATIQGNSFVDNNRKAAAGHLGAIELSPTNQGFEAPQVMWHMRFLDNSFIDDNGVTATQLYAFHPEAGQQANIYSNTISGNTYFAYAGGGAFMEPSTTATMQGAMFNQAAITSAAQFTPIAFADLANIVVVQDGTAANCFDCGVTSLYNNTCATGGTGAFATRVNGVWSCQMKQASLKGSDISSAATIAIPASGDVFIVSGTTTITAVNTCDASSAGRRVSLLFSGALTFTDGGNLKLAGDFVTTADDSITIACNASDWVELSRSVN